MMTKRTTPSPVMAMVLGSTPYFRSSMRGMSISTMRRASNSGAGGTGDSFQSGLTKIWADAGCQTKPRPKAKANSGDDRRRLARRVKLAGRNCRAFGRRRRNIGIGFESGAGRQLVDRLVATPVGMAIELAATHVATQKAVAEILAGQVAGQFGQRHLVDAALEL